MISGVFPRSRIVRMARLVMLGSTALGLSALSPAVAQTRGTAVGVDAFGFDIPAQPMRAALQQLMRQGKLQIGFESADIDGRTSTAVSGSMAAGEALSRLLAGSGLTFRYVTAGSVVIEKAPQAAAGSIELSP